ncbi:MAG TPA: EscU/YscU/HrcU family type III secretion system export apparatus switch protein [Phycisphaerae bacterium]|nr:EscU/YscU/HrcU family type III secretion system export apparatus switch protein [Phycisphaerae bacterium]
MMEGRTRKDRIGERQYPPTPLRLAEARRRGDVPRSADLTRVVSALGAVVLLSLAAPRLGEELVKMTAALLDGRGESMASAGALAERASAAVQPLAAIVMLTAAGAFVAAAVAGMVQGGLTISASRLGPDLGRLSPSAGLARMFSRRAGVRLLSALVKLAAVAAVAFFAIRSLLPEIIRLPRLGGREMLSRSGGWACGLALRAGAVLLALAVLDYLYQRWQHRQDLMMTRLEYLEDLKRMEGSPLARKRRKELAAEMAAGPAALHVPRASAVIASTSGRAVALKLAPNRRSSRVLAVGRGPAGERIRHIALAAGVPVIQDDSLAEALSARCRPATVVPRSQHEAVVRLLARAPRGA